MISSTSNKKQVPYQLYRLKKNKQHDHLFNLLQKSKKQKYNFDIVENNSLDFKVKQAVRKHMIQKRVNNILNLSTSKASVKSQIKVSQPVKYVKKTWIPPIERQVLDKRFSQEQLIIQARKQQEERVNKVKINNALKVINLNKKMRYFGDFLSSQFDGKSKKTFSVCNIPKTRQSKLSFLQTKYKKLMLKDKPKLFILNSPVQQEKYFFNPLAQDQYFGTIMKSSDKQLMRLLIRSLSEQGHFSLTSFTKFYDIFVWQSAPKSQLTKFATKMLMGDNQELLISKISSTVDTICQKINLQDLNHNLQNFSQIMKKLLFGQQLIFALKNQYFLTRKALIESLQRNQQCISIFVNVFYV